MGNFSQPNCTRNTRSVIEKKTAREKLAVCPDLFAQIKYAYIKASQ